MKKLTLLFTLVIAFAVLSFGQADYTMYKVAYFKPDYAKLKELNEAMAKYNKTFNTDPHFGHIWIVNTGPHTGQWLYVFGATTFTALDSRTITKEQREHWLYKVLPNIEEISDGGFWRQSDKLTYEGTIGFTGKEVLTFFKIRSGEEYRFKAMVAKVKEVYEAKEYPNFFQVYYSEFSRICGYDAMIAGGFENWAFFDNKPNFKADYDEVHGEGTFQLLIEEYSDVVEGEYDEIIMYVPELSSDMPE